MIALLAIVAALADTGAPAEDATVPVEVVEVVVAPPVVAPPSEVEHALAELAALLAAIEAAEAAEAEEGD